MRNTCPVIGVSCFDDGFFQVTLIAWLFTSILVIVGGFGGPEENKTKQAR